MLDAVLQALDELVLVLNTILNPLVDLIHDTGLQRGLQDHLLQLRLFFLQMVYHGHQPLVQHPVGPVSVPFHLLSYDFEFMFQICFVRFDLFQLLIKFSGVFLQFDHFLFQNMVFALVVAQTHLVLCKLLECRLQLISFPL